MDRLFPDAPTLDRFEFVEAIAPAHGTQAWRARDRHAGTDVHIEVLASSPRITTADDVRARFAPPEADEPSPYARIVATGIADTKAWIAWEFSGQPATTVLGTDADAEPLASELAWVVLDAATRAVIHAHENRGLYGVLRPSALRLHRGERAVYLFSAERGVPTPDVTGDLETLAHIAFALLVGHAHPGSFPAGVWPLSLARPSEAGARTDAPGAVAAHYGRFDKLPVGFDAWFARCTKPGGTYFSMREAREALRYILAPWAPPEVLTAPRSDLMGPSVVPAYGLSPIVMMQPHYGAPFPPPVPAYGSPAKPYVTALTVAGMIGLAVFILRTRC